MKRNIRLFLIFGLSAAMFLGCGKSDEEETVEQVPTEQIAIEGTEVEDYSALSYSGLEVLAYEGDSQAQIMLGRKLEYGDEETAQNFTEALSWYQMASDSGDYEGTCALGYFYLTGTGVDQNLDKAEELFNAAIEGGVDNAKVGLARVLLTRGEYLSNLDEQGVEDTESDDSKEDSKEESKEESKEDSSEQESTDLEKVVELLTEASKAEDLDGEYYLGFIYEHGIGVALDYSKAFDYYSRVTRSESMALQDQDSINNSNIALGLMYIMGRGVEVDEDTALEHLETASDNGSAKASYYIGQMYESGVGVDKDYEKAMEYYLLAADKDYAPALNQIGYLYYNGYGVDVDFASAVYYQKLAALQGYAIAQVNLGFLYENGYGVERNLETALSYYEMAADSGYEGATEAVVRVKAQINEEL
ncbi:MAG: sel1 repeat family protein [Pseudobutyrivibrio sp.]|nr:sel1 repeat family protein [Pseudobutyrivibrio sp.]